MSHATRARYLLQEETVDKIVGTVPQSLPATKLDRRNREMHLVNEIGVEKLTHRGDATTKAHVDRAWQLLREAACRPVSGYSIR